jgi:chemotaxis protein CheD
MGPAFSKQHISNKDVMLKLPRKLILPGKYYVTAGQMVLETLVGSCVAICIHNRKNHFSAMNHFLLSYHPNPPASEVGRYGNSATDYIIRALFKNDPTASHYDAQIFGGAAVFSKNQDSADVGRNNIEIALEMLDDYRIRVIRKEIGGTRGRRIKFDTMKNFVECRFTGDIPRKKAASARAAD